MKLLIAAEVGRHLVIPRSKFAATAQMPRPQTPESREMGSGNKATLTDPRADDKESPADCRLQGNPCWDAMVSHNHFL